MQFHSDLHSTIESAIRATGARVTSARLQVLGLLQSSQGPLSHSDIEELLTRNALPEIDRVTLYRVLDWLVDVGLAHKAANTRGVFCFTVAQPNIEHKRHAHFRCNDCGKVICLDMPPPSPPKLPNGFRLASVELDISGECPDCVRTHPHSDQHSIGMGALQ
jgi:Fur family ferric uptake transcriptional regulator